jgi:hypothetical protein
MGEVNICRCTWLRVTTGEDLVVAEWELRDGKEDTERLVRAVDIFRTDRGRIIEDAHYCPDVRDADTIARQRTEARQGATTTMICRRRCSTP